MLGTLLVQGPTTGPVLRLLRFARDASLAREVAEGRLALASAAIMRLDDDESEAARSLQVEYEEAQQLALETDEGHPVTDRDRLRLAAIEAQRARLAQLRCEGRIGDDAFHILEEELDWSELHAAPHGHFELREG